MSIAQDRSWIRQQGIAAWYVVGQQRLEVTLGNGPGNGIIIPRYATTSQRNILTTIGQEIREVLLNYDETCPVPSVQFKWGNEVPAMAAPPPPQSPPPPPIIIPPLPPTTPPTTNDREYFV